MHISQYFCYTLELLERPMLQLFFLQLLFCIHDCHFIFIHGDNNWLLLFLFFLQFFPQLFDLLAAAPALFLSSILHEEARSLTSPPAKTEFSDPQPPLQPSSLPPGLCFCTRLDPPIGLLGLLPLLPVLNFEKQVASPFASEILHHPLR